MQTWPPFKCKSPRDLGCQTEERYGTNRIVSKYIQLSLEAKKIYLSYSKTLIDFEERYHIFGGWVKSLLSKQRYYVYKFALITQIIKDVINGNTVTEIDKKSMETATALSFYYMAQLYKIMQITGFTTNRTCDLYIKLKAYIGMKKVTDENGYVPIKFLAQMKFNNIKSAEEAKELIEHLVTDDKAVWKEVDKNDNRSKPKTKFKLL